MAETIFHKIMRGEIPADVVYEDEHLIAFRDIAPQAPVHVLFVPKTDIATLNALPDDGGAAIAGRLVTSAVAYAKSAGLADDGYRLVVNCNAHGGQTVYQLHLHLLGGRSLAWPPG